MRLQDALPYLLALAVGIAGALLIRRIYDRGSPRVRAAMAISAFGVLAAALFTAIVGA